MKNYFISIAMFAFSVITINLSAQTSTKTTTANDASRHLYMDIHELEPGKVKFADVAGAHQKDLATQGKYDVQFLKYWVDESKGLVYCLSSAKDSASIVNTHAEAHGLLPSHVYLVTDGDEALLKGASNLYLDIHYLGAGKVTAGDVAEAHKKDLAKQGAHGVNFINYWVNEKQGVVMCLSQAKSSDAVVQTHKEAHGLLPGTILQVKQGQ